MQHLLRRTLLLPYYCCLVSSFIIRAPNQHVLRLPVHLPKRVPVWYTYQTASLVSGAVAGEGDEASQEPSREQLMERTLKKIAEENAKAELMTQIRKEKHRRHKRKQEGKMKCFDEEARAERKAREETAEQYLKEAFAVDEGRMPPLRDLPPRLRLAFDLAYGESESQLKSLGRQLSMVYGLMRRMAMDTEREGEGADIPSIHLTSATPEMMEVLRIHGGQAWKVHRYESPVFDVFDRDALVYLSPDSPNVLTEVNENKVYVIGGLVDRVILKGRSLGRAHQHHVTTARLPLKEFFTKVPNGGKYLSSPCLAVDRVAQILMLVHGLQQHATSSEAGESDSEAGLPEDPWDVALTRVFLSHAQQQQPPHEQKTEGQIIVPR